MFGSYLTLMTLSMGLYTCEHWVGGTNTVTRSPLPLPLLPVRHPFDPGVDSS